MMETKEDLPIGKKAMKKIVSFLMMTFAFFSASAQAGFLADQKRYKHVRVAIREKEKLLVEDLKKEDIKIKELNILLVAYKAEGEVELFVKTKREHNYRKLASYNVCYSSGMLGPKRRQGDYQVPEGFYFIDRFNPASSYYLSLGLSYPNLSDKIKSEASNLGGDIFIHGSCVSIGCLPMTDDKIKEIYWYAINARNNGQQRIPVYVFPFKMADANFQEYKVRYQNSNELIDFWTNLKTGYDLFSKEKKELKISYAEYGDYKFK
jgi:murein L,D-transpeptidase YafK